MTDKTQDHIVDANKKVREDFEVWWRERGLGGEDVQWEAYQAATQQSAARIAALEAEVAAIAELNHAQWLALENVRHLAARNRKEEWAQHLLRFVDQAGTNKAQIMRKQVDSTALEAEVLALRKDAERYRAFFDAGLPITFMGVEYYTKPDLDADIDAHKEGA